MRSPIEVKNPAPSGDVDAEREQRSRTFNGLTAREWTLLSRNVWDDVSSPREAHQLEHGAVYPVKLAERVITIYSREGDLILDPFVGVGTTVVAARNLNRRAIGIELNPRFCQVARAWLNEAQGDLYRQGKADYRIVHEDCRRLGEVLEENSVQLTFTSPPYADFIHRSVLDRSKTHKTSKIRLENNSTVKPYSDDPRDFGNLPYGQFLRELKQVLALNLSVTRPGGYSVWVVKDHRDTARGVPYIAFHSDLARVAQQAEWLLNDIIVWDQNDQRSLVLLGYPSVFYTNQNCSFLVVLRKRPGPKKEARGEGRSKKRIHSPAR